MSVLDEVHVYICWGADNTALYVGCSAAPHKRLASHRRTKAWWPDVVAVEVTPTYFNRIAGETAERDLIFTLKPLHNIQYNGPYWTAEAKARIGVCDVAVPELTRTYAQRGAA